MSAAGKTMLDALQERAKELHCLYRIHEICGRVEAPLDEVFREAVAIIPIGWEHPAEAFVRLVVGASVYETPDSEPTPWLLAAPIRVRGEVVGNLEVYYRQAFPPADEGPFIKEERRLINTIAELFGQLLLNRHLDSSMRRIDGTGLPVAADAGDWWVITDFLRQIDRPGYVKIARRMLNYLCWSGVEEAQRLLPRFTGSWSGPAGPEEPTDENRPMARRSMDALLKVAEEVFEIASR
ncbi:GAF domain-containing protein, partial [bacterium]|nr:GAF domain-containing protein [bacterium]